MRRLFVRCGCLVREIYLYQNEPRWVVSLLNDIEPGDTPFLNAVPCVFDARGPEVFNELGPNLSMDMYDQHVSAI